MSHPTMGAWIEILKFMQRGRGKKVAPHDGCVDWNFSYTFYNHQIKHQKSHPTMGAWIEILGFSFHEWQGQKSHPTMGAWIEII